MSPAINFKYWFISHKINLGQCNIKCLHSGHPIMAASISLSGATISPSSTQKVGFQFDSNLTLPACQSYCQQMLLPMDIYVIKKSLFYHIQCLRLHRPFYHNIYHLSDPIMPRLLQQQSSNENPFLPNSETPVSYKHGPAPHFSPCPFWPNLRFHLRSSPLAVCYSSDQVQSVRANMEMFEQCHSGLPSKYTESG